MKTKATIKTAHDYITLRIVFSDGVAVNITDGYARFKVTSSSPALIDAVRRKDPATVIAWRTLDKLRVEVSQRPGETFGQRMERFRLLAENSPTLVDFAGKIAA